jgi:hypothetical protein
MPSLDMIYKSFPCFDRGFMAAVEWERRLAIDGSMMASGGLTSL